MKITKIKRVCHVIRQSKITFINDVIHLCLQTIIAKNVMSGGCNILDVLVWPKFLGRKASPMISAGLCCLELCGECTRSFVHVSLSIHVLSKKSSLFDVSFWGNFQLKMFSFMGGLL